MLLLRDLSMAHMAEQLEILERIRATLGHGLQVVHLRVSQGVAAGFAFLPCADVELGDGLYGHVDATPVLCSSTRAFRRLGISSPW